MPDRMIRYFLLRLWRRGLNLLRNLLTAHGRPHDLARGTAIGLVVGLTPFIGLHFFIVLGLAQLMRASKVLAMLAIFISNPWTVVPICVYEGRLAEKVMGCEEQLFTMEAVREVFFDAEGHQTLTQRLRRIATRKEIGDYLFRMMVGGLIIAIPLAAGGYWVTYRLARGIHHRRKRSLARRRAIARESKRSRRKKVASEV